MLKRSDQMFVMGMVLVLILVLSPLIALVVKALYFGDAHTPGHVANLFSNERGSFFYLSPLQVMWNSVRFALTTVAISLTLGTIVAYFLASSGRRWSGFFDAIFMMPLGVAAVTLGFGYIITMNRGVLDLRESWLLLVIAHSLIAYPFVIRSLLPVLRGMDPNLREAASVLGASPFRIFLHVDLPIVGRGMLVGATFAFAVSMGEFGASLLLVRPENTTMPVAIFQFLGKPGEANLGQALAMSSLLMAVVAAGFIAIERFRYRSVGAF
jgi:thiamine transport system permease protein